MSARLATEPTNSSAPARHDRLTHIELDPQGHARPRGAGCVHGCINVCKQSGLMRRARLGRPTQAGRHQSALLRMVLGTILVLAINGFWALAGAPTELGAGEAERPAMAGEWGGVPYGQQTLSQPAVQRVLLPPLAPNLTAFDRTYRVQRILDFQLLDGGPEWTADIRQRLGQTSFHFHRDGRIVIESPGSRDDLYPLSGTYRLQGASPLFAATRSIAGSTSRVETAWAGQIDLSHTPLLLSVEVAGSSIQFYGSKTSRFQAQLELAAR